MDNPAHPWHPWRSQFERQNGLPCPALLQNNNTTGIAYGNGLYTSSESRPQLALAQASGEFTSGRTPNADAGCTGARGTYCHVRPGHNGALVQEQTFYHDHVVSPNMGLPYAPAWSMPNQELPMHAGYPMMEDLDPDQGSQRVNETSYSPDYEINASPFGDSPMTAWDEDYPGEDAVPKAVGNNYEDNSWPPSRPTRGSVYGTSSPSGSFNTTDEEHGDHSRVIPRHVPDSPPIRTSGDRFLKPATSKARKRRSDPRPFRHSPGEGTFDLKMNVKKGRTRRRFSEGEKAVVNAVRKVGACAECHVKHRKCRHKVHSAATSKISPSADNGAPFGSSPGNGSDFILYASSQGSPYLSDVGGNFF